VKAIHAMHAFPLKETPLSIVQCRQEEQSMSNELPAAETSASPPADGGSAADDVSGLPSLAALAIAADPALAPSAAGSFPATELDIAAPADADSYDGHVALALDLAELPGMESVLDGLASSADLFDVPPIDIAGGWDDAGPA
jgi:hypothetical protein